MQHSAARLITDGNVLATLLPRIFFMAPGLGESMNYYKHHIGDYIRDTAHLTALEDGIYRRLLDQYYLHEKPLSSNCQALAKQMRLHTEEERAALASILAEFFTLIDDGYRQKRCDDEIKRANEIIEKRKESGSKGGRSKSLAFAKQKGKQNADTRAGVTTTPLPKSITGTNVPDEKSSSAPTVWDLWVALAGVKHRSTLGAFIRDYGEDAVSNAVAEASRKRPGDPVSYLRGILNAQRKKNTPPRIVV